MDTQPSEENPERDFSTSGASNGTADPYSNLRYVSLVPALTAMGAPIATILDERLARIEAKLDRLLKGQRVL